MMSRNGFPEPQPDSFSLCMIKLLYLIHELQIILIISLCGPYVHHSNPIITTEMTESITTASYLGQLLAPAKLAEGGFVINGVTRLVFLQKEMKKTLWLSLKSYWQY